MSPHTGHTIASLNTPNPQACYSWFLPGTTPDDWILLPSGSNTDLIGLTKPHRPIQEMNGEGVKGFLVGLCCIRPNGISRLKCAYLAAVTSIIFIGCSL